MHSDRTDCLETRQELPYVQRLKQQKKSVSHILFFIAYQLNDFSWNVEGVALCATTEDLKEQKTTSHSFLLAWDLMNSPARWASTPHVQQAKRQSKSDPSNCHPFLVFYAMRLRWFARLKSRRVLLLREARRRVKDQASLNKKCPVWAERPILPRTTPQYFRRREA